MTDIDRARLERLQRAFDRLPSLHAGIFSAIRHDDLTYAEIGKRIGLSSRQVERIFADALYRLVLDVQEQEQGVTIGPIRRFVRERHWNLRLRYRLWRARS